MTVVTAMEALKLVCDAGSNMAEFALALEKCIDYIEASNKIQYANDILNQVKDILNQDEADEKLKFTRVVTHLKSAYRQLYSKSKKTKFPWNRDKTQHKINQICYALAMMHEKLGNSREVIYKYAVELTSLGHPTATNHLTCGDKVYLDDINFVMTDSDLRFLLTDEQYKKFRSVYDPVVYEIRREEEFRRENRIPLIDEDDRMV